MENESMLRMANLLLLSSIFAMCGAVGVNSTNRGLGDRAQAGLVGVIIEYPDGTREDTGWGDGVWDHWRCQYESGGCPDGLLRKENGNYTGCSSSGGVCSGSCTRCAGNPAKRGNYCTPS